MQTLKIFFGYARKVADFSNKVMLVCAVLLAISGFFLHFHKKDLNNTHSNYLSTTRNELYAVLNNPEMDKTDSGRLQKQTVRTLYCIFVGEGCTDNPADGDINYQSSVMGKISGAFTLTYANPPASGVAWLNDSLQNAGFVPATYAQGLGFSSLNSYVKIWTLFKNITYFVMAIAIVVVGFLIMFRYELDSQTVISIENSLPRFALTLLFITFSFAIAGFMVDLMYILLIITFGLFGSLNVPGLAQDRLQELYLLTDAPLTHEIFDGRYLNFYIEGIHGLLNYIPLWIKAVIYPIISVILSFIIYGWISKAAEDGVGGLTIEGGIIAFNGKINIGKALAFYIITGIMLVFIPLFITFILPLVLGLFIMLFLFFRILFLLISTYVRIVIDIIFAPILILPNVIPGNSAFTDWLKRMVGNLLVFPTTIVLLITVQMIALNDETAFFGISTENQFTLPLLSMQNSQLVPIIAAAFLLLIPQLVKKMRDSIAGDPLVDAGPGVLFGGIGGAVGAVVGQYTGLASFSRALGTDSRLGNTLNKVVNLGAGGELSQDRASTKKATPIVDLNSGGGN